jgi:hypothetical protein
VTYEEFRRQIHDALIEAPDGRTWKELRGGLELPYERPCPTWVKVLEREIGLNRETRRGREQVWRVPSDSGS